MTDDGRMAFRLRAETKVCDFVTSDREVDIIQGPLGSGKTRALCARIMRHAQQQRKSRITGLRMSRWGIVRNSYPDLKTTTVRTWLEMFPEHIYGRFNWGQPPSHKILFGDVSLWVDFLALDKPEDVRKLRSTEYTGIAYNELAFIDKELFDEGTSRLRYPGEEHGGSEWHGIIADSNAPDEDHWLAWMTGQVDLPPNLSEDERAQFAWPAHWGFHMQPAAVLEERDNRGIATGKYTVNPDAENLENLRPTYYSSIIPGKSKAWIDSRLRNVVALVVDGSPVWPMFRVETHVAREALRPVPGHEVIIGIDFGRTSGAVFMQTINNRVAVQYEFTWANQGLETTAPQLKRFLTTHYPDFKYRAYGDPKGRDKSTSDERTGYDIFAANGITVQEPPGLKQNNIETRVSAVANLLNEMADGRPRFVLSPLARTLKIAMAGRYHNERDEEGELRPNKDRYSHVADALQYACIGIGEGRKMIGLAPIGSLKPAHVAPKRRSMRRVA